MKNFYPKSFFAVSVFALLTACVASSPDRLSCVQGNCINGNGVKEDYTGRYKKISEGEFRNGNLWDGVVKGDMAGVSRVIFVCENGVITKDLRRPR